MEGGVVVETVEYGSGEGVRVQIRVRDIVRGL